MVVETPYFYGTCNIKEKLPDRLTVWNFASRFNLPIKVSY
jgi:hypothetical protein